MKIKDRYIAKTFLTYSLVVLLVWLGIYGFFNFLSELSSVGVENYSILKALKYTILQMPQVAYDQSSAIILLGCILGMGHLATTGQLIIFRVAGTSILKITWISVKYSIIFIVTMILIGENIAPFLNNYADAGRANALGENSILSSQKGFWIRDGDNFINVENNIDGRVFYGVTIIELNEINKIQRVIKSESALFDGNSLKLNKSDIFSLDKKSFFEDISLKDRNSYDKTVSFNAELVKNLKKAPKDLTTWSIFKQIQFLSANNLRSGTFEVEFYKRAFKPLTLTAMILMAMLFVFGSTRDATLGRKIFFGVAIALSFELISRIGGTMALNFEFNPLFSSILPAFLAIIISIFLLAKK